MRILLDGQQLPIKIPVSKDLLLTLKTIALAQNWRIHYNAANSVIYLNTDSHQPIAYPDRQILPNVEMDSTRLLGKSICIDPGHGGRDPGAIGPAGTYEKDNTLAIALLLRERLERNGAKVYMTRETDQSVAHDSATAQEELEARMSAAKQTKADLLISIHNDGFISSTANGATTYHHGNADASRLATIVQKRLIESLGVNDRGARFASFFVIRYAPMPSILVEVAFISNPDEELLLASEDGRSRAANGIFEGIVGYYRV
ncbi:MAG: cell wall hydrolase/autolysin [Anaerosporomusa subterranea]|jgi:N-acetylmuramoyl-L-alanine amidase|nr:cell wall hydrolase/autolysin [Anaerosporomusa subterranea]